ncbi:MAG: cysteine hydrolase family protein [Paracoccaceae bacterium]|nr:cysteine hydrolase family protein [Paracoccaceae bacterium]
MKRRGKKGHDDKWSLRDDADAEPLIRPLWRQRLVSISTNHLPIQAGLSRSTMLNIDMQKDVLTENRCFATACGLEVTTFPTVIGQTLAVRRAFRTAGVPIIHVAWVTRPDGVILSSKVVDNASDCQARRWDGDNSDPRRVLFDENRSEQSAPALQINAGGMSVGQDLLAGFCDTPLDRILRRLNIKTLFFRGINLDQRGFTTVAGCRSKGFDAVLVQDAIATVSAPHLANAIQYLMRLLHGFAAMSRNILAAISPQNPTGVEP